jgi:hypothetical protein
MGPGYWLGLLLSGDRDGRLFPFHPGLEAAERHVLAYQLKGLTEMAEEYRIRLDRISTSYRTQPRRF